MKLNIYLLATFGIDYIMTALFIAITTYFCADNLNIYNGCACVQLMIIWTILHDHIYWLLFPQILAKEKVNFKYSFDLLFCTLKLAAVFGALVMLDVHTEGYYFNWKGVETLLLIYFEYNFMYQAKDNTSMRFAHAWMHKEENYWMHKHHHESEGDCQTATTFHFDLLDLFLENISGTVLLKVFYVAIGKTPSIHLLSFLLMVWSDQMGHSLNPYSPSFFNPVLDWYMKPNIYHNLHHLIGASYYMSTPYCHLYDPQSLVNDLEKYNRKLKTNISFDLFLDDNVTQLADDITPKGKDETKTK